MSLTRSSVIGVLVLVGAISSVSCAARDGAKPINGGSKTSVFQQPCEEFCRHLRTLGCKEGEPLASGASCETFCINTQDAGHDLGIACVLKIQSCGELPRCGK